MRRWIQPLSTLVAVIAIGYWLTLPPERLAIDGSCKLTDIQSQISAAIYGPEFWKAQDKAISDTLLQLAAQPAVESQAAETREKDSAIEKRMEHLSNKEQSTSSEEPPHETQEQQAARLARMAALAKCQQEIAARER